MKRTIKLRNNKTMIINCEMNMHECCPDGWEPLTIKKLVIITEVTIQSGQREVKGVYHDDYIDLHDVTFYTDTENTVFYSKAIARLAEQDHEIAYVLKVKDSYVMLTDDECKAFLETLEELKTTEAKEKNMYNSIKEAKIKDINKKLDKVKKEMSKIEEYMQHKELLSDTDNEKVRRNYKNLMFEGRDGEYPYGPSKQTYEYKCKQLKALSEKLHQYQDDIIFRYDMGWRYDI